MSCNKIDKLQVAYRLVTLYNDVNFTLRKRWQNLDVLTPKMRFLSNYNIMSCDKQNLTFLLLYY